MKWVKIENSSIPQTDGIRKARIDSKNVCIIRHDDKLYATSVRCPHAGADLSGGWCEKGRLICPYHRHAFDLESGKGDEGQGDYIHVYPLEQRPEGWFIGLEESWLTRLF
ncbi:Rieske (2Fe-2S) protein [Parapedobacter tibetensis]|uniref:Rieske (2Fe-2S) protein n=1 Tax=Parapedobacter tibetensis TaxID=2972951 RepID=UPI00214D7021|nr:Rieske (2Fe-2S) protein [Parapedobacter tibetensis]